MGFGKPAVAGLCENGVDGGQARTRRLSLLLIDARRKKSKDRNIFIPFITLLRNVRHFNIEHG